ncbi:hypothetical protein GCK32_008133 [Trichostrongylus colubriformis]|uniref:procollagen-proline 4-dioxygenase n=1 Tax=Trichostrongylus colubriformis TaxID=6319 RepID=A0AAN8FBB3_TRICO
MKKADNIAFSLIKARNEEAMKMDIKDLNNPVNAFLFIKKKIFDWKRIEQAIFINNPHSFLESIAQKNYGIRYPTQEDLTGAAIGLLRLQDTYRLDTTDLADGRIYKKQGNYTFSARGRELYEEDLTGAAIGLLRLQDTYRLDTTDLADGRIYKKQGNYTFSDPDHPRARGNVKFYQDLLAKEGVRMADKRRSIGRIVNQRPSEDVSENEERSIYEALCRNEVPVVTALPSLTWTPFSLANAWLGGWEHEVADRLNKRIDMMTNLEMATAEALQVQNYGIGGHYGPHSDHEGNKDTVPFIPLEIGDRIATVLFYMSEPTYGGGTVFTEVKLAVSPTKNDALFWYNLMKSGDGDPRTRHAGCPVLLGVKWRQHKSWRMQLRSVSAWATQPKMACLPSMLIFSLMSVTTTTHVMARARFNETYLSTMEPPKNQYYIPQEEEMTLRKVQERLEEVRNLTDRGNLFFGMDHFIDELIEKQPFSWTYHDLMHIVQRFAMGVDEISRDLKQIDSMSVRLLVDAFEDLGHLLDLSGGPDMKKTVKLLRKTVRSSSTADDNLKGVFTSIADMQSVLQSEKFISASLSEYIESEEDRLKHLKDLIKARNEEAMKTDIKDFTNPINAFLFIKKKLFDWKRIEQAVLVNNSRSLLESIAQKSYGLCYPTQEDLTGAAMGLLRLQDTYRLDAADIADGRIYKKQGNYTFKGRSGDCFEIAKAAHNNNDYYHTVLWMEEARRRFEKEDVKTAKLSDILEYLSYSLYRQGNPKHALQLSEEIVTIDPDDPRARENVKFCEDLLAEAGVKVEDMRRSIGRIVNQRPGSVPENEEQTLYEALCRNDVPVSEKDISKLYCYYKRDRPYLVYAPIKVQNYGVGGHFVPHFDHARKEGNESFKSLGTGNRIATVLFYMTEPTYGGGTVFTKVKSVVPPTKNDALFWYNLMKTGDGDPSTRHAACPVLLGVKWVMNKWIHEQGNEFRRRCDLKMSDGERFIGDLGFGPEPRHAPNMSSDLSKDIFNTI